MEDYSLRISKKDSKSIALINYLKSLDFIELKKSNDWWDELNNDHKASIERGLDDIKNGRIHTDEDVRMSMRNHISKSHKK